ncbi:MAG: streptomycin 6-kinase [Gaiellales bacterium]|jgi:streptomycin 6-kinase|nr:streptomycin 6-kinase [Gaiellales bacterium]
MIEVPAGLASAIRDRLGDEGDMWVMSIPSRVAAIERAWSITVEEPFDPPGSAAFTAPAATAGGRVCVLKINAPDERTRWEGEALRRWNGAGAVALLADDGSGTLLLERAQPGTPLTDLDDEDAANEIAATLLERLWQPLPVDHGLPRLRSEAFGFTRSLERQWSSLGRPVPRLVVSRAIAGFAELGEEQPEQVLLHRDLRHGNILRAEREPWLVIDPQPLVGERAYDLGALVRDRAAVLLADRHPSRRIARRVDMLSERLGADRERVREWALAQAVELGLQSLSAGDHETAEEHFRAARWIA